MTPVSTAAGSAIDALPLPVLPQADAPLEKIALETYVPLAKPSLIGLSRAEIAAQLGSIGVAPAQQKMRTAQIWHWMYVRGAQNFAEMSSISKDMRAQLEQHFTVARPEVVAEQISNDGTRKWLLRLPSGTAGEKAHEVECVYIPETDRGTLCVSSQVGCTLTCSFCHTGTQRLVRNLTAGEIVGQIMVARDRLNDWADRDTPNGNRLVTNVVMMGMGEPLYNFEAVRDALLIVADNEGIGISRRRITLSTSGVVPNIFRTGDEIGVMLAISLHAVRDELRNELVPINKKYPLEQLLQACRDYPGASNARRITFEYVMLRGVNDSLEDAKLLVKMLKGIHAKINLIPFNPWPGTKYECSDWDQIEQFSEYIFNAGYSSPVRTPRGRDILAACGQLKSETEKLSARERQALRAMAMTD
ncbi:23S rRNA (adenine(2503)-C(2))-methyltransferase RlmN [Tardiphaga sp.]|jgi:23S rRNA (adenine2503-C2)-methyltransferase|uniref:23S rRNA (adenine(2503)-C(2))-methyltransferase RlmN n=1 Tax=Tardiphaga sp. TaxID=1926292 RepID=UPI0025D01B6F|nr:23S rRNA (adenine(2503)-C(2))-methyltransferase RlmN [Tardiphaga sp.]